MWRAFADAHIHSDGDSNGNAYANSNGNSNGHSDGYSNCDRDRTTAAFADATGATDTVPASPTPISCSV